MNIKIQSPSAGFTLIELSCSVLISSFIIMMMCMIWTHTSTRMYEEKRYCEYFMNFKNSEYQLMEDSRNQVTHLPCAISDRHIAWYTLKPSAILESTHSDLCLIHYRFRQETHSLLRCELSGNELHQYLEHHTLSESVQQAPPNLVEDELSCYWKSVSWKVISKTSVGFYFVNPYSLKYSSPVIYAPINHQP